MRLDFGAKPVTGPQPRTAAVEQAVPRALEADLFIELEQFKTVVAEPLLENGFLGRRSIGMKWLAIALSP